MLLHGGTAAAQANADAASEGEAPSLTASRSLDGSVSLSGVVPDGASRQRFLRAAGLEPPTDGGSIEAWLAGLDGLRLDPSADNADWTASAYRALRAFSLLEAGRLSVTGVAVSLEGRARDADALDRIEALLSPDWFAAVWVDPEPPGLTLSLSESGKIRAEGVLPPGLARSALAEALPGLSLPGRGDGVLTGTADADAALAPSVAPRPPTAPDRAALAEEPRTFERQAASVATPAEAAVWSAVLNALPIALPRMQTGRILLAPRSIAIEGRLRRGFSAADTRAALRSALRGATGAPIVAPDAAGPSDDDAAEETLLAAAPDGAWLIRLDLTDAPPLSRLTVAFADGSLSFAGIRPDGFDADTALIRGGGALRAGLTSGGAGDPFLWREIVDALADLRVAIATLEGVATAEEIVLSGTLYPGYNQADIAEFLKLRLSAAGAEPAIALDLTETPAAEGTERIDLISGSVERFGAEGWTVEDALPAEETEAALPAD
ncbi:MAG: hypothetical protein AAFY66_10530 [Pseudomonadota bacterium]